MDPGASRRRNDLKRPRLGSLDAEPPCPPPRQLHHAEVTPDVRHAQHSILRSSYSSVAGGQISNLWGNNDPIADQLESKYPPNTPDPIHNLTYSSFSKTSRHESSIPKTGNTQTPPLIHSTQILSLPSQTYISGGNNIENNGALHFYHQTSSSSAPDPQLYKHASANAIHTSSAVDNQGLCMPGTRAFTLQHLQSLVSSTESDHPDVIWMHGPAGAGKSAIMRTIANALEEQGVLLGSFFFFRSDPTRNTSTSFVPTLSLQSSASLPASRLHIQNGIESQPTIFSQSIRRQLHTLLETPLKLAAAYEPKWTAQSPLVLVIDGLDECAEVDRQVDIIKVMYRLASTIRSSTNRRVKVLLASRPEKPIKDEFDRNRYSTTVIELNPSDANIDLYYDIQLDGIRREKNLPETWPSPTQVKWLKAKTSGQYSFAHISMGFLKGGDPVERWKMLETGVGTHGLEPFEALDALYATIFRQIPPEMADNALHLVRVWLTYPDLALDIFDNLLERILSLPAGFHSRLLPYLASIISAEDGCYSPHHASLDDFLGDRLRSGKYSLFLDVHTVSALIVGGTFDLCIPPTQPINRETVHSWRAYHQHLYSFLFFYLPQVFEHYSFRILPDMATTLDQLPSLLPTMDLHTFGYCAYFLSRLLSGSRRITTPPLASDPSHIPTVRTLLDQICSIQQLRFSAFEALEDGGDSGLGFFGLLVVFVSGAFDFRSDPFATRVEEIVAHLAHIGQYPPGSGRDMKAPLPLNVLMRQLFAIQDLQGPRLRYPQNSTDPSPLGIWAFLSRPVDTNFPKLHLCLSKTIEIVLDLHLQNTPIQRRIVEFIACPDHRTLAPHAHCVPCVSNLERTQASILYAVFAFIFDPHLSDFEDGPFDYDTRWAIDAQLFARCYHFVNQLHSGRVQGDWNHEQERHKKPMIFVGQRVLSKLMQETPECADPSVVDDIRAMVASLHEMHGQHSAPGSLPRSECWVCGKVQPVGPSRDLGAGSDTASNSENQTIATVPVCRGTL